MHDTTLDRTTGEPGVAEESSWARLSQLDAGRWHSSAFEGVRIPKLADIARFCFDTDSALNIEIKPTPGGDTRTGERVAVEAAALWQGRSQPLLLSSFSTSALRAAQMAAPHLPRALLLDELTPSWFEQASDLGCAGVVMDQELIDAHSAGRLHDAGLFLLSYTVNEARLAERLLNWGVDGLITDVMDRAGWPLDDQLR
jgi:glycerophosphoryl diester phosphodiesterase